MPIVRIDLQQPLERSSHRRPAASRASAAGLGDVVRDPLVVAVAIIAVLTLVFAVYLDTAANQRRATLSSAVQTAVADSAKLEFELTTAAELQRKRAAIQARIQTIESIDRNRFAFIHVMDQAAAALGPSMWLTSLTTTAFDTASGAIAFTLTGYAPAHATVSAYVQQLEISPFIANVAAQGLANTTINKQALVEFTIVGSSELPDASFLETETIQSDGTRTLNTATRAAVPAPDPLLGTGADNRGAALPEALFPVVPPTASSPTAASAGPGSTVSTFGQPPDGRP